MATKKQIDNTLKWMHQEVLIQIKECGCETCRNKRKGWRRNQAELKKLKGNKISCGGG